VAVSWRRGLVPAHAGSAKANRHERAGGGAVEGLLRLGLVGALRVEGVALQAGEDVA
jgi:hypothetical protein